MIEVVKLREGIINSLPAETSYSGGVPALKNLYVPPAHIKALRLDCHIVIGARGVGKSVLTAALNDHDLRKALGASVKELEHTEVRIGFSEKSNITCYPDSDTFSKLLTNTNYTPILIWKAVIVRWLAERLEVKIPCGKWELTIDWVQSEPEELAMLMESASKYFTSMNKYGLIIFDALDRTSQDWRVMDDIVRALLQAILWLKPFKGLTAKVFLREDQFDRTVTDFPDASKLQATRAELTWAIHDLHGLLWQLLINANGDDGALFRKVYENELENSPKKQGDIWLLSSEVQRNNKVQRALFEKLAGPWMGKDKRRGVPYVWAVSHLADGQNLVSPRSFLAAIRQAAEDSLERYFTYPLALHYESIKRGIQKASEIRVNEISEDYPWIQKLMDPLQGLNVPCEFLPIQERWNQDITELTSLSNTSLPPQHLNLNLDSHDIWNGVKVDLIRIGIFTIRKDGRIDMPDLYRVGFGLGRRGGVKTKFQLN